MGINTLLSHYWFRTRNIEYNIVIMKHTHETEIQSKTQIHSFLILDIHNQLDIVLTYIGFIAYLSNTYDLFLN